ncbi:MAG: helix-hairpin-helix domain-containing protein [Actinomycetota bacterium]|nr:helix-hairpin-helix domain-containing protein [Actinomycetota bacterium]
MPKTSKQAAKTLNINSASQSELASLQMVGATRARDLVSYRQKNGPFENWNSLKKVPGFSNQLIQELKSSGATLGGEEEEGEEEW